MGGAVHRARQRCVALRAAARVAARRSHPLACAAYEVLGDEEQRAEYDEFGRTGGQKFRDFASAERHYSSQVQDVWQSWAALGLALSLGIAPIAVATVPKLPLIRDCLRMWRESRERKARVARMAKRRAEEAAYAAQPRRVRTKFVARPEDREMWMGSSSEDEASGDNDSEGATGDAGQGQQRKWLCEPCRKSFKSQAQYDSHCVSRKHKMKAGVRGSASNGGAAASGDGGDGNAGGADGAPHTGEWSDAELALLAKAVARHPGGTPRRWLLIAEAVGTRTEKEVVKQAAKLKRSTALQARARVGGGRGTAADRAAAAVVRGDGPGDAAAADSTPRDAAGADARAATGAGDEPRAWTGDEQRLLEAAIRKANAAVADGSLPKTDKWRTIAAGVPHRSVRECKLRFKECVAAAEASQAARVGSKGSGKGRAKQ